MKLTITFFIVFFSISIYGQSAFLERGQSGFGFGSDLLTYEDVSTYGGNAGYSVSGIFDIGFFIDRVFGQNLFGENLVGTIISPSITFYSHKQNENIPVSFSVGAGYEWQNYSNFILDYFGIVIEGRFFVLEASVSKYFRLTNFIRIQPTIGAAYIIGEFKYEGINGNEKTVQDIALAFDFGLPLAFYSGSKNIFVIVPRIRNIKEITSFGLGLSFIFSTN